MGCWGILHCKASSAFYSVVSGGYLSFWAGHIGCEDNTSEEFSVSAIV
jgi:hypothetical protein